MGQIAGAESLQVCPTLSTFLLHDLLHMSHILPLAMYFKLALLTYRALLRLGEADKAVGFDGELGGRANVPYNLAKFVGGLP